MQQQLQTQNLQLQAEICERQQAEDKFAKVFRISPHPIAITTRQAGRFVDANPAFLQLTGYTQAEVIGYTQAELQLGICPAGEALNQPSANAQVVYNQECELWTKLGEHRIVLLSLEDIELEGIPCTLNLVNDITQRKRLENEFISVVSHELRTPLSSLMGALDVLGTGQLGNLTQGQTALNIAITNTERLIRLVNDILDLERLKFGKITLKLTECNLAHILTQATEAMQAMADRAQVQIQVQPLPMTLWADSDRLIQTLTNLLSNAIKFSAPGSTVWVHAAVPPPTHATLLLTVRDRGRGIPADKLDLIFDRFQQVDTSDARYKGGTGLGLSICRSIVEQHHGKIWAESELGHGSTFYIVLPLHRLEDHE